MMPVIRDCYKNSGFGLSIEIFPPKTEKGEASLRKTIERLIGYQPKLISCTYGAGGSTQTKTMEWCKELQQKFGQTATAHFTCVGSTREQLIDWLTEADRNGIRNIMALRGDAPEGMTEFQATAGGFRYASELVTLIKDRFPHFGIGVAGYPEQHPESPDAATDLKHLKTKVDAGADAIYTQLFYMNDGFYRFRDACEANGIHVPIVPGIMPITEYKRIQRITSMCGTAFPDGLMSRLESVQDNKEAQLEIGVEFAIEQCRQLMDQGVPGIHFYVLNQSTAAERILDALGLSRFEATA